MNLANIFCPNLDCPARGQVGRGNIRVHSLQEERCLCRVCQTTFRINKGSLFYRLKTDARTVTLVITLLAHGCPTQAIVAAFGLDERSVSKWWQRAGRHCQAVHEHLVEGSPLDLRQVQADEIKVKTQAGPFWLAMAVMVPTRLWLGGVISRRRDLALIQALVVRVRAVALCRPLLLAVGGFRSYVTAFQQAFRTKLPRYGQMGRAKLRAWSEVSIVQVVKQHLGEQWMIERRIVQGSSQEIEHLIASSQGQGSINTAYIERLNATFRQRLAGLARRTRALVRQPGTLQAGIYVVGCLYNFCIYHGSLRVPLYLAQGGQRWLRRTPAIAAGLTDHRWTIDELLHFRVPPPRWKPPKRIGRPPKRTQELLKQWCV